MYNLFIKCGLNEKIMWLRNTILSIIFLFLCGAAQAQEQADFLRSMGKMYVVVAVIVLVFFGLVIYLIRLDRKVSGIENEMKNDENS
jgi:hypothetical protein